SNYSPGLPLFVAGLYEVTGGGYERFARLVLAAIGALSVLFAYLIGRRLWSRGAGLIAALVVAIYPALLEYQGMLMSEPLAATLLSGGVLAVLWAWDEGAGWGRWLLAGAVFGALALHRPEYLAIGVLIAAVIFAREARGDRRRSLLRAAVFLGALVLVVAPWTIRNAVALDRFVPISTGGGQVLFAGTYLPSDGNPEKVGAEVVARNPDLFQPQDAERLRLEQILARLAADRHPGMETDQALSKMGKEQLRDGVTEEPIEYAGFVAAKVWRIWSQGPRDVMQEPVWKVLHWALVALGLLGLALLAWRRRWEALLIATIFLAITALSALLVASPRRVLVLVPLLGALASVGLARLASWHAYSDVNSPVAAAEGPDSLSRP
ncbi:MAG TPA: glycosyltransferase family 39 protein, partial [Solirubrobacterales bacterium]|nr:glycosyltransferase family 39 protein [Solirubrobacterales bacterium]